MGQSQNSDSATRILAFRLNSHVAIGMVRHLRSGALSTAHYCFVSIFGQTRSPSSDRSFERTRKDENSKSPRIRAES
jgi:hypothetical protein